jgi:uncharacterized membrane protein
MNITTILIIGVLFVLTDSIWLLTGGKISLQIHQKIQGSPVVFRYGAAIVVYLAMIYLLSLAVSAAHAFTIGFCTYAVYDFTNYALLKDYDLSFAVMDTIWGGILFALVFLEKQYLKL